MGVGGQRRASDVLLPGITRAPEPVCTGAEDLVLTGIQSTDRPARSDSLYRLRYAWPPHNVQLAV